MPQYLHPGVFIEEVQGPQPIQGVATNIGAFVGVAEFGDYNVPTLVTGWDQYQQAFGSFLWDRYMSYAVYDFFQQGGSQCYIVRAEPSETVPQTEITGATGAKLFVSPTSGGTWGSLLNIVVTNYPVDSQQTTELFNLNVMYQSTTKLTPNNYSADLKEKTLQQYILDNDITPVIIYDSKGEKITAYQYYIEQYIGLSFSNPNAQTAAELQLMIQSSLDSQINSTSLFIRAVVTNVSSLTPQRPANTAGKPIKLKANTSPESYSFANRTAGEGIYALDPIETVNLLVMPDLSNLLKDDGTIDGTTIRGIYEEALSYCQEREDLFMIIDPPSGLGLQEIIDFRQGSGSFSGPAFNSAYGALYYPWIIQLDPVSKAQILMPPSGSVAGIYAQTDASIGVYKAPAGTQDGRVNLAVGLNAIVNDSEQDLLNPIGINAIRDLYQIGIVVWGARTLSANTSWTYVNVRRLMTFIEQSLKKASRQYVFEPNSMSLWAQVSRDFSDFLTTIWRQGALFGNTAAEAFFVVVDESNNPPETRDRGELYIDVGVAPVKPAEFIIIRIRQTVQQP